MGLGERAARNKENSMNQEEIEKRNEKARNYQGIISHGPDEVREHSGVKPGRSAMGRSTGWVECPFCKADIEIYLWSFAGCGKRCKCGAKLNWITGTASREQPSRRRRGGVGRHETGRNA